MLIARVTSGCRPLVLAIVVAACATDPDNSHLGTYQLETINGSPLPRPLGTTGSEIIAGVVILRDDRTFADSTTLRSASGVESPQMGIGVYERRGDEIEFIPLAGDHTYFMTYSARDGSLTQQSSPTSVWVYRK